MNRSSVVAALTAAFAASNLCLGSPPVAAQEAGSVSSAEVDIGLMPGVPLAPHEIDPKPKVKIGVIDSGVRQDHPQIGNSVGDVKDFTGEGLGDSLGHGTKVVLVLLHSFYSDAKNLVGPSRALLAQIEVAKVIGKKKATAQEVAGRIVQAIDWLAGHHVRVVNISLSLPEKAADYTRLCATIAEHEDMFFSIAAGNSGQEAVVYPAACSATNKIVVGAATADGKVPAYSGRADLVGRLPPAPVSVSEYWRGEGERRFRSNDLAGARQAFEKGLNANPIPQTFALLAHDLGAVAYNQAQFDDAAGWFERAIKAVPTSSQSYVALSNILTRRERFEAARALLEAGISAGADSPELRDRLARVYLDLDRPKDARAQIAEIERQKPNLDGLADLRRAAQNMVIVEDAIAAGSTPAEFLGIFVKSGEGNLVRFVVKRWNPNLNEVPPGAAVVPLSTAASLGHLAIVNFLLESGASVDGRDRTYGLTALMTAAAAGREEICRELVRRGASLEFQDSLGFTPLMFAAEGGYTEIVRFFLEHGAAVSTKSKEGFTALDYATKYGHSGIAEMITKAANCCTVKCTP